MHKAIRYIGSKQKIFPFLQQHVFSYLREEDKFFDGFSGTGIVSQYIASNYPGVIVGGSDIASYSRVLFNILNLSYAYPQEAGKHIIQLIKEFESLPLYEQGDFFQELSQGGRPTTYPESRLFFHAKTGQTIDSFRLFLKDKLSTGAINALQAQVFLYFLTAYCCSRANTTSVFGAFLKQEPVYKPFNTDFVASILTGLQGIIIAQNGAKEVSLENSSKCLTPRKYRFYQGQIVDNLRTIEVQDIIYLDPPYSTRRYESNYHILDYLVNLDWSAKDIKIGSKTAQPHTIPPNAFAQKSKTQDIFSDMIKEAVSKSRLLAISYNTDGIISKEWMENFCFQQGYKLITHTQTYKRFQSNRNIKNIKSLQEILWIIQKS